MRDKLGVDRAGTGCVRVVGHQIASQMADDAAKLHVLGSTPHKLPGDGHSMAVHQPMSGDNKWQRYRDIVVLEADGVVVLLLPCRTSMKVFKSVR